MIILDTHIWIWWVHDDPLLPLNFRSYIQDQEPTGIGISIVSCWEIAKLVEYKRLALPVPLAEWLDLALSYPEIQLLELTPRIVVESTQLPGQFHRDPADQQIVATARIHGCPLVTLDEKIRSYPFVRLAP